MSDWESVLNRKTDGLRKSFIEFLEDIGTVEDCVYILNNNLQDLGIVSKVYVPPKDPTKIELTNQNILNVMQTNQSRRRKTLRKSKRRPY